MLIRIRGWIFSEHSWPLMLLALSVAFWLAPRSWWVSLIFSFLTVFYLAWAAAWSLEYWHIQRKAPNLLFIIANVFFGGAILIGAIINLPANVGRDFTILRMISRTLYGIGLPFLAVAVWKECWRIGRRILDAWHNWRKASE